MSATGRNAGGARILRASARAELMVRTVAGRYRPADRAEVCEAAAAYLLADAAPIDYAAAPEACRRILTVRLAALDREAFACLWLNNRHGVIGLDVLFHGALDRASVSPQVVARHALLRNAASVILAHNHPSGTPEPSAADEMITARLKQALALLDVRVVDHMIVTATGITSFSERGLL